MVNLSAERPHASPAHVTLHPDGFVDTPCLKELVHRAMTYLQAGIPLHLSGLPGTGKTTLALHAAALLGRPVVLMHGDDELNTSDLVGTENGYSLRKVRDNFVHSVHKTEESVSTFWVDNRLTLACRHGLTLVYDEFTRSRPEANNVLLSVLEERRLDLPASRGKGTVLNVHPDFKAIFTSNPVEYAGVHKVQNALMDRMVNIRMPHLDQDSEVAITRARTGVSRADADKIVAIVRESRDLHPKSKGSTLRACIMIGKCLAQDGARAVAGDGKFIHICADILGQDLLDKKKDAITLANLIAKHCAS